MKTHTRQFAHILLGMVGTLCFLWISFPAAGYVLRDEKRGTQLSVFGLGTVRFNNARITGDEKAFEQSDNGFGEGFDTEEFLSLTANGVLWREYGLEGEVRYSREDNPEWYFRVKLFRDAHYLLLGDQPHLFQDTYFTRYTNLFRGLTLHLETQQWQTTTMGAVTRGAAVKDELTPIGISGPYLLRHAPVTPDSERVVLEVHNLYDPQHIIERIPQVRNVDYTIDYDTGEIMFAKPVARETFRGDLVKIVVYYRSIAESSAFNTALLGGRVAVSPTRWFTLGSSYISEFPCPDAAFSDGFETRQEIYSIDSTLTLGNLLKLTTEYALSQDQSLTTAQSDPAQGFHATLTGKIGERFELAGQYRRAERDFLTFANPEINPNQQELVVNGKYTYRPRQFIDAGYSVLQDNLPPDRTTPTTTTHHPYLGWEAYVREYTQLFTKYDYIRSVDDQHPRLTDKQTQILLVGGQQEFLHAPLLKNLTLRTEYQRSDVEDETNQEPDTLTHQLGVRLTSEPVKNATGYLEQRERWVYNNDLAAYTERQDISEIGAALKHWARGTLSAKYRYQANYNLIESDRISDSHTVIVQPTYTLLTELELSGKFELCEDHTYAPGTSAASLQKDYTTRTINTESRLIYTPKKDLTLRLRYAYTQTEDMTAAALTTREDTTEARFNYAFDERKTRVTAVVKLERDLLEAPPASKTETYTYTYLLSAGRQLTDRWDALAQYKREIEGVSDDNVRNDFLGEVGFRMGRFLKCAGGYQYTEFTNNDRAEQGYIARSAYVKIIGTL